MYFLMFCVLATSSVIEAIKLNLSPTLDENGRELTGFKLQIKDICENCEISELIKQNEQEDLKLKYTNNLAKVNERASKRPFYWDKTAASDENDQIRYITNDIINNINDLTKINDNINDNVKDNFNNNYDENRINRNKYDINKFNDGRSYDIKYYPSNVYNIKNRYESNFPLKKNNEHKLKRFKGKPYRFDTDRTEKYNDNQNNDNAYNRFTPKNMQYNINHYNNGIYNHNAYNNYQNKNKNNFLDQNSIENTAFNMNDINVNKIVPNNEKYHENYADTKSAENKIGGKDDDDYYDSNEDYENNMKSIYYDAKNIYNDYKNTENVNKIIKSNLNRYNNGIVQYNPYSNYRNKNQNKIQKEDLNENIEFNMDDVIENKVVLSYDRYHENYADTNSAEDRIGGKDDYDYNEDYENNMRSIYYDAQPKYNDYENTQNIEEIIEFDLNRYNNGIVKYNPYRNYSNKNKNEIHKDSSNENIAFNMDDVNDNKEVLSYDRYHENYADTNSAEDRIGDKDDYDYNKDYENNMRSIYYDAQHKYNDYENTQNIEEIIESNLNRYNNGILKYNLYSDYDNKDRNKFYKQDLNENIAYIDDVNYKYHENDVDANSAQGKIGGKDDDYNDKSSEDDFSEIMRRRSNLGKCCRACKDAYVAACKYLECSDRAYRCLKRECSKSCKKHFDDTC